MEIKAHTAENIQKHASIGLIKVFWAPGISPGYHSVDDSRILDSQRPGHVVAFRPISSKIKT